MQVRVDPHDPRWRDAFDVEAARIIRALGEPAVRVHHIGSTAIEGIPAKPVIDILVEVDDIQRMDRQAAAMETLGYESLGEFGIPGRRYFRKNDAIGIRSHQVHAFLADSPEAVRHLAFCAYMTAHAAEARVYGALKERLAALYPDTIEAYMDGKDAYVKECEQLALSWWKLRPRS